MARVRTSTRKHAHTQTSKHGVEYVIVNLRNNNIQSNRLDTHRLLTAERRETLVVDAFVARLLLRLGWVLHVSHVQPLRCHAHVEEDLVDGGHDGRRLEQLVDVAPWSWCQCVSTACHARRR